MTVRMPDEYIEKINSLSKKMGLKRSDVVRMALKQFLDENQGEVDQNPFQKIKSMLGIVESGIKDLGHRHRYYLIRKIRRTSNL
ncbi:MAG: ribbon-helix-helix domain-containing protein [Caldisericum sp.]